jgi:mRNA interferase HigB
MHIISRKRLNEFVEKHPQAQAPLARWYSLVKRHDFTNFDNLRETFASADHVGKFTVFDIGGNNIRLITAIHYNRHRIYIRAVLTHAEYDARRWKE